MSYQGSLPFDELFAWQNLTRELPRQVIGSRVVFYGFEGRKITIFKVARDSYKLTSESFTQLKGRVEYENNIRFFEVELMSAVLKDSKKHLHRYKRSEKRKTKWSEQVWKCVESNCRSYSPGDLLEGKEAACFKCREPIIIMDEQLKRKNLVFTCIKCSHKPEAIVHKVADKVVEDMFKDLGIEELGKDPVLNFEGTGTDGDGI